MSKDIQAMRQNYEQAALDIAHTAESPLQQFTKWFEEAVASELKEPNAFILATATPDGQPSSRTMLLKGIEDQGFVFFTNYESRKGKELIANPQAALLFFWGELERQVRIEGKLERLSDADNDAYFYSRPEGSQYGAMASPQSTVIASREWLENRMQEIMAAGAPKRPDHWGGFLLRPKTMEFWQGRPSRLHDRIQYQWTGKSWERYRLAP
ncbi:MAG TPA: pyridoxamine 5'-phosphate oxidase [Bacteroidetes bacterium]|jgi:pyridoxamine 5'-phosphate oxidase|nr:MAG: hypothetical protein ABR94_00565 [Sphingobacteriales bacterium BACL12 MAG-120802-bin5]KRP13700.1 MAG: hypothetical protein ABR95_00640 [Sphingobacteriales bacterium BACL12 MAG-120813-bin55]HCK21224.1 pyridoxamine 5'-phosphate oxidase [Bacteroidota bacterium]